MKGLLICCTVNADEVCSQASYLILARDAIHSFLHQGLIGMIARDMGAARKSV
jgi:hypothetical protein